MYMDGYYGASLEMYDEYSTICLVGGGIGVTPLVSILEDIVAKLHLGEALRQKVFLVFTFRELSLLEEIHPLLMQIKELDPQQQYFCLHFNLTRVPTSELLDQPIDHERLAGKPHVSANEYDTSVTSKAPKPFAEPLRSRTTKVVMYGVVFFTTFLIWILVKYGTKVQADNKNLWPLQNFVEIVLVILVAMCGVYTFTYMEGKRNTESAGYAGSLVTPGGMQPYASDAHTLRDLIAEYNVAVGRRPNMAEIMRKVYNSHKHFTTTHPDTAAIGNSTVGVFVSGPEALKLSTESAISDLGINHFDVHEEEFEL
ncbi:hypothetical protein PHPALM_29649 [Phytophthora palmivora]|uniref:Ferric reductase NAD binding domain-containing protein n=1 Tax=Phytophthora palmivora TaxID=4796 RepID=A0A2P4X710_9STRA|nr:hypothetical protein PHPALM_29649 [Phytophthora palmivora]